MLNDAMTAFNIQVFAKKHGCYVSIKYELKGPKRILVILVDRDIAVRLKLTQISYVWFYLCNSIWYICIRYKQF